MYYKWQSYYVWFLRYRVQHNFLSFGLFFALLTSPPPFWATFCPFTPIKTKKNQNFEKYHFTQCTKNHDHMLQCSWDMVCDGCNCYFSFWAFFALLPLSPQQPKKSQFNKNEKNTWRYHHFTHLFQKLWSIDIQFLRYGAQQMDRPADGQMEKVISRGGCPT